MVSPVGVSGRDHPADSNSKCKSPEAHVLWRVQEHGMKPERIQARGWAGHVWPLAFSLSVVGSQYRLWGRGATWFALGFSGIAFTVVLRIDCRVVWVEAWRPLRRLLEMLVAWIRKVTEEVMRSSWMLDIFWKFQWDLLEWVRKREESRSQGWSPGLGPKQRQGRRCHQLRRGRL